MNAIPPAIAERLLSVPARHLIARAVLFVILLLPLGLIHGLISERQARSAEASGAVSALWGGEQILLGPILRVPLRSTATPGQWDTASEGYAYFLPKTLDADIGLRSERRRRGLFAVPVYRASATLSGRFEAIAATEGAATPDWTSVELLIGVQDVRALQGHASLQWNGEDVELEPSTGRRIEPGIPGIHARLPAGAADGAAFRLQLQFNGSRRFRLAPFGRQTTARIHSDWPHPSFGGGWLPDRSRIEASGFEADWHISHLGRGFPQQWRVHDDDRSQAPALGETHFGVDLIEPVDEYRLAERIGKYAILTVLFTFLTVWLIELLSGRYLHPIQYALLGAALCLFGLLQLALAEHLGFTAGFVAAAGAICALVSYYGHAILGSPGRAFALGGVLSAIYGYLYVVLHAEDLALLSGSIALFLALAAVMVLTRHVDWHR